MLELKKISKDDISILKKWINSERLCCQWSGGHFKYPIDNDQMEAYLELVENEKDRDIAFIAMHKEERVPIGHIKIGQVDNKSAMFQFIIIGESEIRGKGFGRQMLSLAVEYAFQKMELNTLKLRVFSFNERAIKCYKAIGFQEKEPFERLFIINGKEEVWKGINMELTKK